MSRTSSVVAIGFFFANLQQITKGSRIFHRDSVR